MGDQMLRWFESGGTCQPPEAASSAVALWLLVRWPGPAPRACRRGVGVGDGPCCCAAQAAGKSDELLSPAAFQPASSRPPAACCNLHGVAFALSLRVSPTLQQWWLRFDHSRPPRCAQFRLRAHSSRAQPTHLPVCRRSPSLAPLGPRAPVSHACLPPFLAFCSLHTTGLGVMLLGWDSIQLPLQLYELSGFHLTISILGVWETLNKVGCATAAPQCVPYP